MLYIYRELKTIRDQLCKLDVIIQKLYELQTAVHQLQVLEAKVAHTLDEVLSDVTDESSKIDGLLVLLAGIKQQLEDALGGLTLPAGVQAKIDAVFDGVEANKSKVMAAIDANTPPAPPGPATVAGQAPA